MNIKNIILDIKEKISIIEYIKKYTSLRKSGTGWISKCPFRDHHDKTPSFYVYNDRYKCFGCNKSGDVINFAQEYLQISFNEAIRGICKEYGINYSNVPIPKQALNPIYDTLQLTSEIYERALSKEPKVQSYLKSRGITNYTKYKIGWSDNGVLPDISFTDLENAGLIYNSRPFFYNRIMFPIFDHIGICGFGGRALNNVNPKYLNSPQTQIFDKSSLLYGASLYRGGDLFLVEGYLDVLALAEHNLSGVAPMGTSITLQHLELLWKMNPCPYIVLDGDSAGRSATTKLVNLAIPYLAHNKTLKIINLRDSDPADIIQTSGIAAWHHYVANAQEIIDILWQRLNGTPEQYTSSKDSLYLQLAQIKDYKLRQTYCNMLDLRKPTKWQPKITTKPKINKVNYMFGLLYKYPDLCKDFQEEIARMTLTSQYEELRKSALQIAENELPESEWEITSEWASYTTGPELIWRNLFVEHELNQNNTITRNQYLQSPTEENWLKLLRDLKNKE